MNDLHVFNCARCPVSVESKWLPPDCPECGDPCQFDPSAKPIPAETRAALEADRLESLAQPPHGGVAVAWVRRHSQVNNARPLLSFDSLTPNDERMGWTQSPLFDHPPQPLSAAEVDYLRQLEMHIQGDAVGSMVVMDQKMARGLAAIIRRLAAPPVVVDGECKKCGAPTDPDYGHVGDCKAPPAPVGAGGGK